MFGSKRNHTYFVLFSKLGFTDAMIEEAREDDSIMLVDLKQIMEG